MLTNAPNQGRRVAAMQLHGFKLGYLVLFAPLNLPCEEEEKQDGTNLPIAERMGNRILQ